MRNIVEQIAQIPIKFIECSPEMISCHFFLLICVGLNDGGETKKTSYKFNPSFSFYHFIFFSFKYILSLLNLKFKSVLIIFFLIFNFILQLLSFFILNLLLFYILNLIFSFFLTSNISHAPFFKSSLKKVNVNKRKLFFFETIQNYLQLLSRILFRHGRFWNLPRSSFFILV